MTRARRDFSFAGRRVHLLLESIPQDQDDGRTGSGEEKRPLFDIVACTSIGGMNAAVIVSNTTILTMVYRGTLISYLSNRLIDAEYSNEVITSVQLVLSSAM